MEGIINFSLPWILLAASSVILLILTVFVCVCWRSSKYKDDCSYVMENGKNKSQLANNMPQIVTGNKQKYYSNNNISYSSINQTNDFQTETVPNESFPFGILNLFRYIQKNKCKDDENDLTRVFTEELEESNTDMMIKKFDNSVLCLNWNENSDNESNDGCMKMDDEACSCISYDSRTTFKSAVPYYNRTYSIADTFRSVNSEN